MTSSKVADSRMTSAYNEHKQQHQLPLLVTSKDPRFGEADSKFTVSAISEAGAPSLSLQLLQPFLFFFFGGWGFLPPFQPHLVLAMGH